MVECGTAKNCRDTVECPMLRKAVRHSNNKIIPSSDAANKIPCCIVCMYPSFGFRLVAAAVQIDLGTYSNRINTSATAAATATDSKNSIEESAS